MTRSSRTQIVPGGFFFWLLFVLFYLFIFFSPSSLHGHKMAATAPSTSSTTSSHTFLRQQKGLPLPCISVRELRNLFHKSILYVCQDSLLIREQVTFPFPRHSLTGQGKELHQDWLKLQQNYLLCMAMGTGFPETCDYLNTPEFC